MIGREPLRRGHGFSLVVAHDTVGFPQFARAAVVRLTSTASAPGFGGGTVTADRQGPDHGGHRNTPDESR